MYLKNGVEVYALKWSASWCHAMSHLQIGVHADCCEDGNESMTLIKHEEYGEKLN
jgi:hypothetical protein